MKEWCNDGPGASDNGGRVGDALGRDTLKRVNVAKVV